jgi:glucose-6-phosphate isomerase
MEAVINKMELELASFTGAVEKRLRSIEKKQINKRIWEKDVTLWKKDAKSKELISDSLGWLDIIPKMTAAIPQILQFVQNIRADGFTHMVVVGMGGNSLVPLVFKHTFEAGEDGLKLSTIDTTDPATIQAIERKQPLRETLFIIFDKLGKTAETSALGDYFYEKMKAIKGDNAGSHFVAITDSGTPLVEKARVLHYRHTFLNSEDISDHYSALSYVGMIPAALMGLDLRVLLKRAIKMQQDCQTYNLPSENPALELGAILGEMANQKRNKLTLVLPDSLSAFGMWLEQLIAISTGKEGKGILPITGEALLAPSYYRDDRLFVHLHLNGEQKPGVKEKLHKLTSAGHPLVTIELNDKLDIAGEFYRWQMAVAVASAIIGINAFDQPNVRESKERTHQVLSKFEKEAALPVIDPALTEGQLTFFTYRNKFKNAKGLLDTFLNGEHAGDYLAIQAFLPEELHTDQLLQEFRMVLQQRLKRAITVGYGPRFLHSTGQFHKGGTNTGLFIQLTADDEVEMSVPGKNYSFGTFKRAQADGDFTLMLTHSRRIIRVDLNGNIQQGMDKLIKLVTQS